LGEVLKERGREPRFANACIPHRIMVSSRSAPALRTTGGWLKPESRCLVPANSFAEYAPEPNPETKKKDVIWFALDDDRPLFAFAGIWTEFKGVRAARVAPVSPFFRLCHPPPDTRIN
jgi:putative SOS response-associated peptidase YedK